MALLGVQVSYCSPAALVRTTKELYDAVGYEFITNILLNDTLTISAKDWPQTVNLTRSVVISGTPQRMAARTYVLLDFNNMAMMFQLAPGVTMRFRGLEVCGVGRAPSSLVCMEDKHGRPVEDGGGAFAGRA